MTTDENGGSSEARRKRLYFRAKRRGFKEVDLIFGTYADAALWTLDETGLDAFEALLQAPDQIVFSWFKDEAPVPHEFDTAVFRAMKALCQRKDPIWSV